jgi:hypothetical protein
LQGVIIKLWVHFWGGSLTCVHAVSQGLSVSWEFQTLFENSSLDGTGVTLMAGRRFSLISRYSPLARIIADETEYGLLKKLF